MTMVTIVRDYIVVRLKLGNRAGGNCLLADIEVLKPTDLAPGVHLTAHFFKLPDQVHLPI